MFKPIAQVSIRAMREDAIALVHECHYIVRSAHRIKDGLQDLAGFEGFKQKRQGLWKAKLLLFSESLADLRERLGTADAPGGELLEWLEADQPAIQVLGAAGASRTWFAHVLANAVIDAVDW